MKILWKSLQWIFGIMFLLFSISLFSGKTFISATIVLLGSLSLIPPIQKSIHHLTKKEIFTKKIKVIISVIVIVFFFIGILNIESTTNNKNNNKEEVKPHSFEQIPIPEKKCSDGTKSGECSLNQPFICDINNITLIKKSSLCGCPSKYEPYQEYCVKKRCSDGTIIDQCSKDKPKFCEEEGLVDYPLQCGCPEGYDLAVNICEISIAQIKKTSTTVSYDDLFRYNEKYIGQTVYFRGEIVQVLNGESNDYQLRINVKNELYVGYMKDTIFVYYSGERLLEGDIIDLYGEVKGLMTYKAVLGNEITIPEINALHTELVKKASEPQ